MLRTNVVSCNCKSSSIAAAATHCAKSGPHLAQQPSANDSGHDCSSGRMRYHAKQKTPLPIRAWRSLQPSICLSQLLQRIECLADLIGAAERIGESFDFQKLVDCHTFRGRFSRSGMYDRSPSSFTRFPFGILQTVGKPQLDFHASCCKPCDNLFGCRCGVRRDVLTHCRRLRASF